MLFSWTLIYEKDYSALYEKITLIMKSIYFKWKGHIIYEKDHETWKNYINYEKYLSLKEESHYLWKVLFFKRTDHIYYEKDHRALFEKMTLIVKIIIERWMKESIEYVCLYCKSNATST